MTDGKNREKTILIYGEPRYFVPYIRQKGIPIELLYMDLSLFLAIIRRLFFMLKMPKHIWYGTWKHKLKSVKTVIFFSTSYLDVLEYIKSVNPNIRIIFWYWNPVVRSINPDKVPDKLCEKWSFDMDDCKNYNMAFNTTFYPNNIKLPLNKIEYDVVFVGQDKGRRALINDIKDQLLAVDLNSLVYIVDDNATHRNYKGASPVVSYQEYLTFISKSAAILDVVQEGQNGLTLRPMESLFFKKKLITNDKLISTYDFYRRENIFIIGVDKMELLKQFLATPFEPVPDSIANYYDVSEWLERFE